MTLIFTLLIVAAFMCWLIAAIPGSRMPEWVPRAIFFVAALIWAIPQLSGV